MILNILIMMQSSINIYKLFDTNANKKKLFRVLDNNKNMRFNKL